MTSYSFKEPTGNKVKYAIGQPMGLFSSWAAMALTNHAIVRLAFVRCGLTNFDYLILGDDIVIFQNEAANEYVRIMEALGVSTKPQDSIMPRSTHPCEIAKRLFRNGVEVGPLPFGQFKASESLF